MAFKGIPFDSKKVTDSFGTYEDRQVFSTDIAKYFGFVSSDGICLKDDEELTNQLLVEAGTDSEVILNPGTIKIQGRMGWITESESLFTNPGGSLPRIDSAVIELNLSTSVRGFVFKIVEGEESSNPEPPILVRTPDVWQLGLGNFYRPANSTTLGEFTDTRLDSERCGISKVATPNIGADTLTLWQESYPDITNLNDILYLIGSEGLPEEFGGTHSKSLPKARQNINFIGVNPIASIAEDTPANWATFGTGVARIYGDGLLNEQPSAYGVLENIPLNYDGTNVMQRFVATSSYEDINGAEFYRAGDGTEWLFGWRKTIGYGTDGNTITAGNVPFGLHALTVGCSSELSLSTAAGKVTCGRVYSNVNAVTSGILEASDGGIKVLRKGRYLVSASVYGSSMTAGDALSAAIYQGTRATAGAYAQTAGRTYTTVSIPPRVLSLAAGETFYLYTYNINSATGIIEASNNTLLTVIAID